MHISFHGFKNVGFVGANQKKFSMNPQTQCHIELTNKNGNDLDEYQDMLKKYPNKLNPNVLNIKSVKSSFRDNFIHHLYVNEHEIDMEKPNGVEEMQRISALMKKIEETPHKQLELDTNYFRSYEVITSFLKTFLDSVVEKHSGSKVLDQEAFDKTIKQAHSELTVIRGAKLIDKNINEDIKDYFS